MNRRGFLRMMGLVPVGVAVGALPSLAEPKADIARLALKVDTTEVERLLEQLRRDVPRLAMEAHREAQARRAL